MIDAARQETVVIEKDACAVGGRPGLHVRIASVIRRRLAVVLVLTFVASRILILVFLAGEGSDLATQKRYVERIVGGKVPFRDFFPEYPPLNFAYTTIPAIMDPSLDWYFQVFRGLTCSVDCLIFAMLLRSCGRPAADMGKVELSPGPYLLYILATMALGPLIYDRVDLVLGAMLTIAVVALLAGLEGRFKLAVGAGIAFKLIPLVLVPMILAREWGRADRKLPRTCAALFLPIFLSFDVVLLAGGYRFDRLLEFHLQRPVQIESGPASLAMVFMKFGLPAEVIASYRSWNLETPIGRWLAGIGASLLAAVCIASALLVLRRPSSFIATLASGSERCVAIAERNASFALLMVAVLAATMALSKVLSPQYFLILLPVLVLLPTPRDRTAAIANSLLVAAIYILTGLIFPWWYGDLVALSPGAEFMLIVRNVLLVTLAISLAFRALSGSAPTARSEAGIPANSATGPVGSKPQALA